MIYDKIIHGKFVDLRSITLADADFSYEIRMDEKYRDIVGQPATSVEAQSKYIEWQMKEPGDYYFVVLNKKGEKIGLIGVYNIEGNIAEVGREVNRGNPMETTEAQLLLSEFCAEVLNIDKVYYVIYLNNSNNISNQKKKDKVPLKIIERNGVQCAYYESEVYTKFYYKAKKMLERIGVEQSD